VIYLLDVNALLALGFHQHEFHNRIANWVAALDPEAVLATTPITELGFVRVLSQVSQYDITLDQARTLLSRIKSSRVRRFIFIADDVSGEDLPRWVKTGRRTTDGHLSALAAAKGSVLATLDSGIPKAFIIPEG
jgi:predicted nucleic acid-binding protein